MRKRPKIGDWVLVRARIHVAAGQIGHVCDDLPNEANGTIRFIVGNGITQAEPRHLEVIDKRTALSQMLVNCAKGEEW